MSEEINPKIEGMSIEDEKFGGSIDAATGMPAEGKFRVRKRKRVSYLTINKITSVDYKDVALLKKFINDHGKILPTRQSGNNAEQQRMVSRAIRRAREMALLPFVVTEYPKERERTSFGRSSRYNREPAPVVETTEPAAVQEAKETKTE